MKLILIWTLLVINSFVFSQPVLHVHIVSHNEPTDNLDVSLNYTKAKSRALQLAAIVDSKNVKWDLQTSDGFVYGARADENATGTNIFKTLATPPYNDNIEIDPRKKNYAGHNIADQWYLLDSLGANPTKVVGGFIYYVCPPSSPTLIDWWPFTDTVTGLVYGNKVKFNILSGAGSLPAHCHDLNDFGIFKPDTVDNFYSHNPARNLWCMGVGCAPVLDSLSDEQAIIDLIQGQVDSIQNGLWPANKFYVTRIMTNQREYGPLFMTKIAKVIDSLNLIPSTKLKWATIEECFADFQAWQISSGLDYSQWMCGETITGVTENTSTSIKGIYPNPAQTRFTILLGDNEKHVLRIYNSSGILLMNSTVTNNQQIDISAFGRGMYFVRVDNETTHKLLTE